MPPLPFPPAPIVDLSQEPRREIEPLVVEDAPIVRLLVRAANWAALFAVLALPVCLMIWKGWL